MYKVNIEILENLKKQLVKSNVLLSEGVVNSTNPKYSKTYRDNEKLITLLEEEFHIK